MKNKFIKPTFQERDTRAFVAIGYNDACINFLVSFYRYDFRVLKECLSDVTEYNEYRGVKVAKAFEKIENLLDKALFGREGSPVLYLVLEPNQRVGDTWIPKEAKQIEKEVELIKDAFESTGPDEFSRMDSSMHYGDATVRLWWD
jgi:hypothetical protein